ncbi:MAG: ROK family protein [Pseudomonadota bacterium]
MSPTDDIRLGLDLGGTKIEAAILSGSGEILARERVAMPAGDYAAALATTSDLVREVETQAGARAPGAGVGTPGTLSARTGLLRNAYSTPMNDAPLDVDLARVLDRPVRLENDANCFALAEARSGAGQGMHSVFGVILGTGVGGGVVIGGAPVRGRNGIGSEWGHNRLPALSVEELDAPRCDCGRSGCIEAWCCGPGLIRDHFHRTGSEMDPEMIAAFADAGDFEATESLDLHAGRLARGLAMVVNLVDPDVIVLGGGLSKMQHLYRVLPDLIRPHVFADAFATPVVENTLGDSAGVIGAAWLCPQRSEEAE